MQLKKGSQIEVEIQDIAFGNDNDEVKDILSNSNAGMMFGYNDSGEEFFKNYSNLKTNAEFVIGFERKEISKEMGSILNLI